MSNIEEIWDIMDTIEDLWYDDNWTGAKPLLDDLENRVINTDAPDVEIRSLRLLIDDVRHELDRRPIHPPDAYDKFTTLRAQIKRILGGED